MSKKNLIIIATLLLASFLPVYVNYALASDTSTSPSAGITTDKIILLGSTNRGHKKSLLIAEGYYQNGQLTIDFGGLIANESVNVTIFSSSGTVLLSDTVYVDATGTLELFIDLTLYDELWIEISSADYSFSGAM